MKKYINITLFGLKLSSPALIRSNTVTISYTISPLLKPKYILFMETLGFCIISSLPYILEGQWDIIHFIPSLNTLPSLNILDKTEFQHLIFYFSTIIQILFQSLAIFHFHSILQLLLPTLTCHVRIR